MATKTPKLEFYKHKGQHRWRLKARNGKVLAASSEGFQKRNGAKLNWKRINEAGNTASVVHLEKATDKAPPESAKQPGYQTLQGE